MFFVGLYELTIDAKHRLSIPHAIRSKMNCDTDGRSFYAMPGQTPEIVAIYPERYFETQVRNVVPREESLSDRVHAFRKFELSQAALIDPDSQGRILIPERLLKRAGIKKSDAAAMDVTLIGVQDHLELWSREAYDRFQDEQWQQYAENRKQALAEYRALPKDTEHSGAGRPA